MAKSYYIVGYTNREVTDIATILYKGFDFNKFLLAVCKIPKDKRALLNGIQIEKEKEWAELEIIDNTHIDEEEAGI